MLYHPIALVANSIILPHFLISIHIIELKAPDRPLSSPHNGGALLISLLSGHHHFPTVTFWPDPSSPMIWQPLVAEGLFLKPPATPRCIQEKAGIPQPGLARVFCPSPVLPGMLPSRYGLSLDARITLEAFSD